MDSSSECPEGYEWECVDKISGVCTADCATCPSVRVCSALCASFGVCTGPAERWEGLKRRACTTCAMEGHLRTGTSTCVGCEFFRRKE